MKLSILDQSPISEGTKASDALEAHTLVSKSS